MNFNKLVKTVFLTEIFKGMALTFKAMLTKPVTRQYPEEPRESLPGFRGLHALVRKEDGTEKCIACGLCGAICPAQCIKIYTGEGAENQKVAERYEIEVLRCIFCGLCVEACPVGAIVLTGHYAYAAGNREELYMTKEMLLENYDKYMAGTKGDEYLKRFWRPLAEDFIEHEDQAVFETLQLVKKEGK